MLGVVGMLRCCMPNDGVGDLMMGVHDMMVGVQGMMMYIYIICIHTQSKSV